MYWQSPSCGIFDTYDVQGWDPRCSQVRARGGRAQRDGRGGAEGSPLVLGTPQVPGKDLGFQKDVKKPCQCVLLWNCSRQHWEAGDIFGLEHPCSRRILLLVWFTTTRAKNPGGWAGLISGVSLINTPPFASVSPSVPAWVCSAPQAAHPWLSQARLTFLCMHSPARISPSNWNLSPSKWQLPF